MSRESRGNREIKKSNDVKGIRGNRPKVLTSHVYDQGGMKSPLGIESRKIGKGWREQSRIIIAKEQKMELAFATECELVLLENSFFGRNIFAIYGTLVAYRRTDTISGSGSRYGIGFVVGE